MVAGASRFVVEHQIQNVFFSPRLALRNATQLMMQQASPCVVANIKSKTPAVDPKRFHDCNRTMFGKTEVRKKDCRERDQTLIIEIDRLFGQHSIVAQW